MTAKIGAAKIIGLVTLGVILSAALCAAQGSCPWVNAATVVDAPDSTVSDIQTSVADAGNLCTFRYRKSDGLYNVQIAVRAAAGDGHETAADEAQCKSAKMPLPHIANEAVLCSTGAHRERVIGRVRDKIFIVNVDARIEHGSTDTEKSLGAMATLIAGQVAGNLF